MRITDQYIWNFVFTLFFLVLIFMATIILHNIGYKTPESLTILEVVLMMLATFRFTRLFVYDAITAFFREQFWDAEVLKNGSVVLVKPEHGPRRTLADLLSCQWCFGAWSGATVAFFYLLTPYAFFPVLILAISGVGTFMQLLANMVGWKAELLKQECEYRSK